MADFTDDYIYTSTHDFKNNISHYLQLLQREVYRAVIIKRYSREVAMVVPINRLKRETEDKKTGASNEAPADNPLKPYSG